MPRRRRLSGKHCASWRNPIGFAQSREIDASPDERRSKAKRAVTTGLNHESQQTLRRRSVINMNDVVVINNHGQPPGMYELPSHRNALSPSRSSNVVDQVFRFADVTVDVGRRKITRG